MTAASQIARIARLAPLLALLAGCPATPYCHCQLSDRCAEFTQDCQETGIVCNGKDGKDGKCSLIDAVGSCVIDDTRTDYFYTPDFTTASADIECDGFFTPLP